MRKFEIAVPISGWQLYEVEADSLADAIEMVANGDCDSMGMDAIEWEGDTNKWDCEEID